VDLTTRLAPAETTVTGCDGNDAVPNEGKRKGQIYRYGYEIDIGVEVVSCLIVDRLKAGLYNPSREYDKAYLLLNRLLIIDSF
jgi:hypothetical protein